MLIAGVGLAVPVGAACGATTPNGPPPPPVDGGPPDAGPDIDATDAPPDVPPTQTALVVDVSHSGAVVNDVVQDGPVSQIVARGMIELTGKTTPTEAWSSLFDAQDVVGIKVSPVGWPKVFSQVATVKAIIAGLNLAGVTNDQIIVFDRYQSYLDAIGYPAQLPTGIRFMTSAAGYTEDQTDPTGGYDVTQYADILPVYPGDDPTNPLKRRSHLSNIVSNVVTKVVNVPALKDHRSAGLTLALKNMTYGCVNNVSRTHVPPDNWTKDFLPVIAAMPKLRQKVVLHVADALIAGYEGGPEYGGPSFKSFVRSSLLFARDPVALDRIGWEIIDAERTKNGLPLLANSGLKLTNAGNEAFDERQPQHVLQAGAAGLGISDLTKIEHRLVAL